MGAKGKGGGGGKKGGGMKGGGGRAVEKKLDVSMLESRDVLLLRLCWRLC
jgi:hypothetical protein